VEKIFETNISEHVSIIRLVLWYLMPLLTIYHLYRGGSIIRSW